jgi:hypothetical protein
MSVVTLGQVGMSTISVDGMGRGGSTSRGIQVSFAKSRSFGMSSVTTPSLMNFDIAGVYSRMGTVTHHVVLQISYKI